MERQTVVKGVPWCFKGDTNLDVCENKGNSEVKERCNLCIWGKPVEGAVGLGGADISTRLERSLPSIRLIG
ncbi:hypothetical protein A2410_03010 [Candidatus Shapirobacteria bacterium RIFOXYC1_FULL_38_24]|uniref:Uncharacterized protein n=2 Tax=Candidatus Shapironibacteriota TaxID=1752721 RepID=A0A0G0JNS6_9BACT|nr:MAG: hypothetical protein US90_C0018G0052 [Candidatus Shapirobacteria bacterium GW2011_GWE2_38_30]KKQ90280.1 MAG: hypothetical protein UT14_C0041G0013 [Candidatus Shapirobacteria bacterium GW2011_GWE1_38_92]OGL56483.1 MAG: hypothetical protein A2410_03010 [Candidatus Shapirobacteria bacterium RIFOXYC1_FULL_38_24]HAP37416.1 hypothetical protein [Candidatus Shapirobacteria bacterium]HCU55193.1 hypothetical protein [Candidatus Shapirobacteria bacterium]